MKFITNWNKSSLLFWSLLGLVVASFFYQIYSHRADYLREYDLIAAEEKYKYSQFNRENNEVRYVLEDDEVYSWAGYNYLKSQDPTIINFEHPPLGKLFIGISILLFGNEKVLQIIWGIIFLWIVYKLSLLIIKNKALSLILLIILIWEPLFRDQLRLSLLDLPQVFFILFALYLTIKKNINHRTLFVIGICLGAIVSIKFFASGLVFSAFIYLALLTIRKVSIKKLIQPTLIALFVYLISYFGYFLSGYGVGDFLKLHFYVLKFYKDFIPNYPPFEIWRIILTGYWRTWFGGQLYISVPSWWIGWPIGVGASIAILFKKLPLGTKIPAIWLVLYLALNSFHVVFPRYLLVILPIGYIYFVYWMKLVLVRLVR